jgi:tRNA(Ile)-lysidine synthase
VRSALADLPAGSTVLVACSGGPDSLALLAGTAFCAAHAGLRAGLVTVDHGLQPGSADRAAALAAWATERGLQPARAVTVSVQAAGGPEAAARSARYAALDAAVADTGAAAVLLGHTRDDQAETVLLALARGSGSRALAGMAAVRGRYRRPLLALPRDTVHAAAAADPWLRGRPAWDDPHNTDPAYRRSRLRGVLSTLGESLGVDLAANLARSAAQVGADGELLDALAADSVGSVCTAAGPGLLELDVTGLAALPGPLRSRVIRAALLDAGVPGGALRADHIEAVDSLAVDWHGQGTVALPHGVRAGRRHGRLQLRRGPAATTTEPVPAASGASNLGTPQLGTPQGGSACTTATSTRS